jgi:predicted amidohydrolase YtcJ
MIKIGPAKFADVAALSYNPLTVTDEQFKRIHLVIPMQGGKMVYTAPS